MTNNPADTLKDCREEFEKWFKAKHPHLAHIDLTNIDLTNCDLAFDMYTGWKAAWQTRALTAQDVQGGEVNHQKAVLRIKDAHYLLYAGTKQAVEDALKEALALLVKGDG